MIYWGQIARYVSSISWPQRRFQGIRLRDIPIGLSSSWLPPVVVGLGRPDDPPAQETFISLGPRWSARTGNYQQRKIGTSAPLARFLEWFLTEKDSEGID